MAVEHVAATRAPARTDVATVVVVDDEVAFAEAIGLAMSLTPDLDVVGRAHCGQDARELVLRSRPHLLICDYRLGGATTGVECARDLRLAGYDAPIVILTSYLAPQVLREVDTVRRAVALSKQASITSLITDFRAVLAGTYSPGLPEGDGLLSVGELEVLEAINAGHSAAKIADDLHLSLHTIRSRIKSLMRKLEVGSQVEAVAEATRLGLLVPPA